MKEKDFNADRYGDLCLNDSDGARRRRMAELAAHFARLGYGLARPHILDAGCASGQLTEEIRKQAPWARITAVDASGECVRKVVWEGWADEGLRCTLGADEIALPVASVDVVHASEILEHVFYTEAMLRDFWRVTRIGGRLILSTPNLASWFNRVFVLLGLQPLWTETGVESSNDGNPLRRKPGLPAGHIRSYTLSSLRAILSRTGWEVEEVHGQSLFSNRLRGLDGLISRFLPSLAGDLIVIARKASVPR